MKACEEEARSGESTTALRILAIDDEIAALERVKPKWVLFFGTGLIAFLLLALVIITHIAGSFDESFIKKTITVVAASCAVLAVQLDKNRRKRLRLDRELDELVADPLTLINPVDGPR